MSDTAVELTPEDWARARSDPRVVPLLALLQEGVVLALNAFILWTEFSHMSLPLSGGTVYGEITALAYASCTLRQRDLQFSSDLRQSGQADPTVNAVFAVRADADEIA